MRRIPTWPIAAGSLLLGFAVAQATGIRPLGGLVLAAGAVLCALRWRRSAGMARTAGLLILYFAAFVVTHILADTLGAWPSVVLAAAVIGLAVWAIADTARVHADAPA